MQLYDQSFISSATILVSANLFPWDKVFLSDYCHKWSLPHSKIEMEIPLKAYKLRFDSFTEHS